jgi:hypothetical protein
MPSAESPVPHPLFALVAAGLSALVGCNNSGVAEGSVTHPTLIEVAPESFLGGVPCTEREGGLTRYVATLTDEDNGFRLPSSPPAPCTAGVGFGFVVPGRRYTVQIDGYDSALLAPRAPGSPLMVAAAAGSDPATIASAALRSPAWSAECSPTRSSAYTVIRAAGCTTLTATSDKPPSPTEVRVGTAALLGDLECGSGPGQVARLSATLDAGEPEPRVVEVACGEADELVFTGVPARRAVTAFVSAFEADGAEAFAGARCRAFTLPDASVEASCSRLSELGTLRVELAGALDLLGLSCSSQSFSELRIDVPGQEAPRVFYPPDCVLPYDQAFPAGSAAVTLTVSGAEPEAATLTCFANVTPGSTTVAICEQNPAP